MFINLFLFIIILLIINLFIISCNYEVYRNQFSIYFNRGYNTIKKEEKSGDEYINHLLYNNIFSIVKIGQSSIPIYLFLTFNHSDINIISSKYLNSIAYNKDSSKDIILLKNDIFKFPKAEEINDLYFNLNTATIVNEKENISYLGIGINDYNNKNSFINQLKAKKIISNRRFSILFKEKSITDDIQFDGQILFGLLPHEMTILYNENDLRWVSIANNKNNKNDLKWQIKFDSIYYNTEKESLNTKEAEFDLSLNLMIGPEEYREKILKKYFAKFIEEKICKEEIFYNEQDGQFYVSYSCKQHYDIEDFPTLSFYNKEMNETFVMKYEQLLCVFKNRAFLKVVFKKNAENKKWILGRAFMEVFPLVFDFDNKKVGYYKTKVTENSPVLMSIFFVVVISILGGGFYIGLKHENKQKIELGKQKKDDDYQQKEKKIIEKKISSPKEKIERKGKK